jgi:hypothetical protein
MAKDWRREAMADEMDEPQHFTRVEAEALLPRLEPPLRQLQALMGELSETLERYATLQAKMQGNGQTHQREYQALRTRLGEVRAAIETHIRAIAALGALLKDPHTGLIDFPALHEGRTVYLCWLLGEGERIRWWHEVEAGFAGRQPLED